MPMIPGVFLSGLLLFLTFTSAEATIYVAAYDPATGATGLAYSSSGGHFWQTRVKGKGLIGAGAYGLCPSAKPAGLLAAGDSAELVGQKLGEQCTAVGWESYRLAIVTSDGAISAVIGKTGCSVENPECGERHLRDFAVVGGGLRKGVLAAAEEGFAALDPGEPLACRLIKTLRAIYAAGGEKADFIGASVTVDDPARLNFLHWEARGAKALLLQTLQTQMTQEGFACR